MKRRTFLGVISAGAAGVLTEGLPEILAAASQARDSTFQLGGDLLVQPARFWRDAPNGRGDLGLAA